MPAITLTRAMMGGGPMVPENDFKSDAHLIRQAIHELAKAVAHL
jgi:hypothetical protein